MYRDFGEKKIQLDEDGSSVRDGDDLCWRGRQHLRPMTIHFTDPKSFQEEKAGMNPTPSSDYLH
jgi:hypothetical protein